MKNQITCTKTTNWTAPTVANSPDTWNFMKRMEMRSGKHREDRNRCRKGKTSYTFYSKCMDYKYIFFQLSSSLASVTLSPLNNDALPSSTSGPRPTVFSTNEFNPDLPGPTVTLLQRQRSLAARPTNRTSSNATVRAPTVPHLPHPALPPPPPSTLATCANQCASRNCSNSSQLREKLTL